MHCELFSIQKLDYAPHHHVTRHRHNLSELVFFLDADGHTVIDRKKHSFKTWDIAYIPPLTLHDEYHKKPQSQTLSILFKDDPPVCGLTAGLVQLADCRPLFDIAHDLYRETIEQPAHYEQMLPHKLSLLLLELARRLDKKPAGGRDLGYAANFLAENYSQKIDFAALAKSCGYSYDYFRHLFKEKFGLSPQNYVIARRLESARRMLAETDFSLADIALFCGFSDNAQFSVMFKKKYGVSPKQYQLSRRQNRA